MFITTLLVVKIINKRGSSNIQDLRVYFTTKFPGFTKRWSQHKIYLNMYHDIKFHIFFKLLILRSYGNVRYQQ